MAVEVVAVVGEGEAEVLVPVVGPMQVPLVGTVVVVVRSFTEQALIFTTLVAEAVVHQVVVLVAVPVQVVVVQVVVTHL